MPYLFFKERFYRKNPGSMEELKHNIEQIIDNINPETLSKVARNTPKGRMLVFGEAVDTFWRLL
jgi:hypothetical protein